VKLDGGVSVRADGMLVSAEAGGPIATLNKLALPETTTAGAAPANPFAKVTDKALLEKISTKLAETHKGLAGKAPDDATTLEWRQGRGAALSLMGEASMRAYAMGDKALGDKLAGKLLTAVKAEPWRASRDFTMESVLSRPEMKSAPGIKATQEALYPSKPPYDKWLADGKIQILMTLDNDGSLIADNVDFYKSIGFKSKKQTDGSYVLSRKGTGGKPDVEVTIPALPKDGKEPALFNEMDNPKYDVVAYGGHAGHGQRIEAAVEKGVKGTGQDKAIVLLQCWGHGNVESLERAYPDAQLLSTTEMTSDDYDWLLLENMIDGFQAKKGWEDLRKKTERDLTRDFKDDTGLNIESHYFYPTTRSVHVAKMDRDGDGVNDQNDHIFNVIYPKRIDAAGGYDPVVQSVPKYALDGTSLNQAINQVSLVVRYDHLLSPADEAKLVWNADKWKPGGFFEPAANDLRAFQFKKNTAGEVEVAVSTRFAHTGKQELSRMLAYESGLWMADEAGIAGADKTAFAIGMTQRVIDAQGSWASNGALLDEPWAEEELFSKRYGLSGFTFAALSKELGDSHDDYTPASYAKVKAIASRIPNAAGLASRAPTKVGDEIPVTQDIKFLATSGWTSVSKDAVASALRKLGVAGDVAAFQPQYLNQNQPTNVVITVTEGGKNKLVSLGIDSEGTVRSAARLGINLDRRTDEAMQRTLGEWFTNVPDASAAYTRERAAGKSVGDSMAAAIQAAVGKAPAGTDLSLWGIDRMVQEGVLATADQAKIREAAHRLFP